MASSADPAYAAWGIAKEKEPGQEEEDKAWELEEGIPQFEDPFIQKYLDGRDALIQREKQQRSDRLFREALSPTAFEACSIIDQIRYEESQTLWTTEYEDTLASNDSDIHPGMMFSLAKERMETSKLWRIVRKMPKGALLHCHFEAMVDLEWLFKEAMQTEGLCILATAPLHTADGLAKAPFKFTYAKAGSEGKASIWSEQYVADTPVPVTEAADSFPEGGREAFIPWLRSRFTVTHEEALKHHEGINEIWRKFTSIFPILGSLIFYEPLFRHLLRRIFHQLREDGIQYVEFRHGFTNPFRREGVEEPDKDYTHVYSIFTEELEAFQATDEGKDFWGARIIVSAVRRFDKRTIVQTMKETIEMKAEFPEVIAGFDFVGQEDLGMPLAELTTLVFWFRKECAQAGVNIPFFFHAGETLGDGDETDENLFDALLLGTRRIGHGFSLYKHPLLIDMVKEKKVLIESCPISNEVLRLCASIKSHPLPALLARGVPCCLSNDDPSLLGHGTCGVSHDFWQALQGWENLGLAGLGSLAENSVRWAAFEDEDSKEWQSGIKMGAVGKTIKAARLKEWLGSWERFCQWVVEEFGEDADYSAEGADSKD